MKYRWEIINSLIGRYGYKSYLEIGVKDGVCFNRVNCAAKIGMDIKPLIVNKNVYKMSSDEFFDCQPDNRSFNIIFIDGGHHEEQVDRDILSSLRFLAPGGTIVMHDCDPKERQFANYERSAGQVLWSGTAYRSYLKLRCSNTDLKMYVVDIDWGCGIIQQGKQKLIDIPDGYTWDDYDTNKTEWLNLISIEEFQRRLA